MCPPGYHHNGFMATPEREHRRQVHRDTVLQILYYSYSALRHLQNIPDKYSLRLCSALDIWPLLLISRIINMGLFSV